MLIMRGTCLEVAPHRAWALKELPSCSSLPVNTPRMQARQGAPAASAAGLEDTRGPQWVLSSAPACGQVRADRALAGPACA